MQMRLGTRANRVCTQVPTACFNWSRLPLVYRFVNCDRYLIHVFVNAFNHLTPH